ncbi:molybdate transport system substrate-binding protein [Amycolatopsis bartoniae]|uniref:Molybdate-binding protein ModA n=1 Tax=Amycolatopsis bartoniae TaxID=941986 RepID=A0A8H9IU65_9PSEU|nr:molybdate ABC transporter substrate-binding protein [Amycolatopsis bartoniae]MBB2934964.1 molybdate transport system substrate-binding protein [Amycolatopsis bartoniae]TVT01993.1 molybdate ABC transporter substrate-binding protein [Amycolatopsis bartoniae]GHF43478.1 molybdate-binding protein [Amycolatopsis bartoniae]
MKKVLATLAGVALVITGCGSGSDSGSGGSSSSAPGPRTLTVFAAASLTESFNALKTEFEAAHPGVTVTYNFAGSSSLVQQLDNGAKADVFASADQANMDKAVQGGVIDGSPTVFATNKLTIAVAPGNPKGLKAFGDLTQGGLKVVVCATQVPCGSATQKVEKSTGVTLKPVSEEQDVKQVLTKVESGDADAGLVYVTDANTANGKVAQVDFPESAQAVNNYPIAVVKNAPQAQLAQEFEQFVLGAQGQQELTKVGFGTPAK